MAETTPNKSVSVDKNNPRRLSKVCEFMNYSGREAFKKLRTNILIALEASGKSSGIIVGVTSAQPSEGKSTVTLNLAYSLAELGKSVLLVDADMRRPTVNQYLGVPNSPGLSEILSGADNLSDCVLHYKSTTDQTHFDIIRSGNPPQNPAELLNSGRFKKLLDVLAKNFDIVLLDLPPVNAVIDAINASKHTDGMIVVVRENHCPNYILASCMDQLRFAKANVLGFVMNGCMAGAGKHYQYKNHYEYRSDR